jgi:GTP-binding protein
MNLEFELKTLADAGLVGLPNAGKSTLLKAVSNAHPQIAPYPFTTLNPYVGTIDFADYWTMTVADMPGILPGAHQNLGLGLRFLRHIERNKVFVYVIDLAGKEPWKDLECLQAELEAYKIGLTARPSIVVGNKADVSEMAKNNLTILSSKTSLPIVPVSAKFGKNITLLTSTLRNMVEKL